MFRYLENFRHAGAPFKAACCTLLTVCLLMLSTAVLAAQGAVILLYHHVAEDTPPSTTISPADFEAHLSYLRDNGFTVVGLDRAIESLRSNQALPEKSVVITFDDGYSSIYSEAFPLLQSYGYPFTLFLSTGPIDSGLRNYMNWDQIREMSDAGVIIANHMVDHPYMLEPLDSESDSERLGRLRAELLQAEQRIEQETGQSHRYLAYPYGEYDPAIKSILQELNFVGLAQNSGAVGPRVGFSCSAQIPACQHLCQSGHGAYQVRHAAL